MKTVKITPPEGYEIDKEKSTFEEIVFKPIEKKFPKSWEEIEELNGWWIGYDSELNNAGRKSDEILDDRNIFPTKEIAEAVLELAQLLQLRDIYRQGWKPDWGNRNLYKWSIIIIENRLQRQLSAISNTIFCFQTEEIRNLFYENFQDKLLKLLPLYE